MTSRLLLVVAVLGTAWPVRLGAQPNLVSYVSSPGDWIGQGATFFTTNTADFSVGPVFGGLSQVRVSAFGFSAEFDAPGQDILTVGDYPNATRFPFNSTEPGLSVTGNGRGCNMACGNFKVIELGTNLAGQVEHLWLTFTQRCECGSSSFSGEIRFQSVLAPPPPPPQILQVPGEIGTIQQAISLARRGDTVSVSPGVYFERIDFLGKEIVVESVAGPAVTIIDGQRLGSVVTIGGGVGRAGKLRGFTLRNGRPSFDGGGIFVSGGASPTITGNLIISNQACAGAGIHVSFSSPLILSNVIANNSITTCSPGSGGGIYVGGAAAAEIVGNVITNNSSGRAGGIELFASGTPLIQDNFIAWNRGPDAGGISMVNFSDATIVGNVIVWNEGFNGVGGVSWLVPSGNRGPFMINNTVAFNNGATASGVLCDGFDRNALLANNVIAGTNGRTALVIGTFNDSFQPIMRNNALFGNGGTAFGGLGPSPVGSNSNLAANPLFLDPQVLDFHVGALSPLIDAASNPDAPDHDFDGLPRPRDGNADGTSISDIGAYEYVPRPPAAPRDLVAISGPSVVTLNWRAAPDAVSYFVKRSPSSGGPYQLLGQVTITNFVDGSAISNLVFFYVVSGANAAGEGTNSLEASARAGNVPPTAVDDVVTTPEDIPVDIPVLANDTEPNGDSISLVSFTQPANGLVNTNLAFLRYTPVSNFNGTNRFFYAVTDGRGTFATGAVTVVVTPVNDPPIVANSTLILTGDTSGVMLSFQASDIDGDALTLQFVTPPQRGVLNPTLLTYRPAHGFVGMDSLVFRVHDGRTNSVTATLTLTVRAPADLDGDGIPNYWETLYDINNRNDDRDGDGHPNYSEYLSNTDPRDPASVLRLLSLTRAPNGQSTIRWPSAGGTRYRVQYSEGTNSGFDGVFFDLPRAVGLEMDPGLEGVRSVMSFTDDPLPPAGRHRFFRVKAVTQ